MPVHCCHFRCECFHVPRGGNDDMPPRSNDNIWNPGHGEAGLGTVRLAAIVSQLLSQWEGKCQDVWCLAACHSTSDSCQRCPEPGRSREGKVIESVGFEVSCLCRGPGCGEEAGGRCANTRLSTQHLLEQTVNRKRLRNTVIECHTLCSYIWCKRTNTRVIRSTHTSKCDHSSVITRLNVPGCRAKRFPLTRFNYQADRG